MNQFDAVPSTRMITDSFEVLTLQGRGKSMTVDLL